jgi:hypothetical protein
MLLPFALLLAACDGRSRTPDTVDPLRSRGTNVGSFATFAENGVTFQYPAVWEPRAPLGPEGSAWSVVLGPTQGLGHVEVLAYDAVTEPTQEQMEQFALDVFRFFENEAFGDEQQGDIVETTIAGVPALEARFIRPGGAEGESAERRALVFTHGTVAYALDCFFLSDDIDLIAGCDLVVESLSLEDA